LGFHFSSEAAGDAIGGVAALSAVGSNIVSAGGQGDIRLGSTKQVLAGLGETWKRTKPHENRCRTNQAE
jgi:hypothetical protein